MTMSVTEALKILNQIDPSKRLIDIDGKIELARRVVGRYEESSKILNGESIETPLFLSQEEVKSLREAWYAQPVAARPTGRPTLEEANAILKSHTTPSGKVIMNNDIEGDAAARVIGRSSEVMMVFNGHKGPFDYLSKKEQKILQKIVKASDKPLSKMRSTNPAKKGFWQKVFRWPLGQKKEKQPTFDWTNPLKWRDVKFQHNGEVLFSHRLNITHLSPEQREQVKTELSKRNIRFSERPASFDSEGIRKGDMTIRISDKESIERLRDFVFNWARQPSIRPVAMPVEEYNRLEEKRKSLSRTPINSSQVTGPKKTANVSALPNRKDNDSAR